MSGTFFDTQCSTHVIWRILFYCAKQQWDTYDTRILALLNAVTIRPAAVKIVCSPKGARRIAAESRP